MSIIEIILIGIGLAMDAFAVSICKGLSMKKLEFRKAIVIALYFGIFQDHWIAFILLGFIGVNMIKEVFKDDEEVNDDISVKTMLLLGIATSIDALACRNNFCIFKSKYNFGCNFNWNCDFSIIGFRSYDR